MQILKRPEGNLPEDFHLSRRGLAGAIFAGYAVAAFAADAEPIVTDEQGLITETVMLPTEGKSIRGYVARPRVEGRFPAVIVVNEVFGLHAYILDVCRRLAKIGYVAIAPGFFDRAGDPAPLTDFPSIMKIVATATDPQILGDVGATLRFLATAPYVEARKIGITGFCWGGRVVWDACETFPDFKAGVAWYGQLGPNPTQPTDPSKMWPIQHVAELKCPVLGLYGGKDPLSQLVDPMRDALKAAGKTTSDIIVYADAGHGFHADYRPSYNAADAEDGWRRLLAFFGANGLLPRPYRFG
ncbi:MAG TPA: dienelactone hydrolase family protein [Caulobacteraceae bacterium]|nr:dienelactone hydrolase family protein [Caulobacteraceae bacterium]